MELQCLGQTGGFKLHLFLPLTNCTVLRKLFTSLILRVLICFLLSWTLKYAADVEEPRLAHQSWGTFSKLLNLLVFQFPHL